MEEIWKSIGDNHDVSNFGNVRSWVNNRRNIRSTPKLRKNTLHKHGYLHLQLGRKSKLIHRLVATAFIPNPDNLPEVDHMDFDRKNNHVSNLQWVTRSTNIKRTYSHGTNHNTYVPPPPTKMDELDRLTLQMFYPYYKQKQWADLFEVAVQTIQRYRPYKRR